MGGGRWRGAARVLHRGCPLVVVGPHSAAHDITNQATSSAGTTRGVRVLYVMELSGPREGPLQGPSGVFTTCENNIKGALTNSFIIHPFTLTFDHFDVR
eukprot:9034020-Pyramimonas_sp.AAC.2